MFEKVHGLWSKNPLTFSCTIFKAFVRKNFSKIQIFFSAHKKAAEAVESALLRECGFHVLSAERKNAGHPKKHGRPAKGNRCGYLAQELDWGGEAPLSCKSNLRAATCIFSSRMVS